MGSLSVSTFHLGCCRQPGSACLETGALMASAFGILYLMATQDPAGRQARARPSGVKAVTASSSLDYPWGNTRPLQRLMRLEAALLRARALLAAEDTFTGERHAARATVREHFQALIES